jgi:serine/threonine protein phosphatase 1
MLNRLKRTANPHIACLEHNFTGTDYIIGDIHGCLDAVNKLLKEVKFNISKDRLICTGDLTHRGPNSLQCLGLLNDPWFSTVRGNHEENTIDALNLHFGMPTTRSDAFYQLAKDGGLWLCELVAKSFTKSSKAPLINQALSEALYNLQSLPKIILVEAENPKKTNYMVVHSFLLKEQKLDPSDPDFESNAMYSLEELKAIANGKRPLQFPKLLNEGKHVGYHIKKLDAEELAEKLTPSSLEEIKSIGQTPIFCGHTPLKHPSIFLNHIHIDTGAGKENKGDIQRKLSMINTKTGELHQVNADFPEIKVEPKDYAKKLEKALEKGDKLPSIA